MNLDNKQVKHWVFDLDNTLYPSDNNLFAQISDRMGYFIADRYDLPLEQAKARQKKFFHAYGTTLRGLMVEHDVQPDEFLEYVHDIDFSFLAPDPALKTVLGKLHGRMIIYTNGSVPYAERVLEHIGLSNMFDDIFAIENADYLPKPAAASYQKMIETTGVAPQDAVMVEDMAQNLIPASRMGMKTVWLPTAEEWSARGHEADHIDYTVNDLTAWLEQLTGQA
ncbi:pyrimidine 5'-nucleotidase [Paremcibacter congregatus]|uniref:Pyrimidine 5'-nucleotidase n=1 Tax=Paremcibacter congregatus TaxID=2043170 RepID=A0A2G4YWB8_9PROT|nr:pyrimidine 5'-nucleotidase [Paremcibacter congregatus]PHZ86634.1 pyrimidine 5'-nucleotidase [Paremcibacter congregatus]QDE26436.1 pyrimidine 5'-nucleotidase [Paremcibacter congregatus]|tara:strand:- start:9665 stop:10333 length:669 start_codon:yes stop_codon:yes gene_type:complete